MLPADIERVVEIERRSYDTPWSADDFARQLASADHRYWVASITAQIIGYAGLQLAGTARGHVTTVTVDPAHREHGIGTRLMLALTHEGLGQGSPASASRSASPTARPAPSTSASASPL